MGTIGLLPCETAFRESQESLATALTEAKSVETVDILGAEGAEGKGANGLRQQSFSLPYAAGLYARREGRRTPQATQMTTLIIRKTTRACGSHCEQDETPE